MATETRKDQQTYKVIGTRPIRPDGLDKVTGRALYGSDIRLPGMLYGKVLRSPHAHALIKSIDYRAALRMPGVKAVVTSDDLPDPEDIIQDLGESAASVRDLSSNVLARRKALYRGHAIAAVAADSPHTAEEALEKIKVEYEVLSPVLDVRKAMEKGAPILHEDMRTRAFGRVVSDGPSNANRYYRFVLGDADKAFAEADVVVEREFTTKTVHQGYIEPQNATALWNQDGTITIWCSSQGHFSVQEQVGNVLHVPVSRIKVIPMEIGGGFGGKINVYLQPVAAILSRATGKPVKMAMTRQEVFEASGPGCGTYMKVKMGATKDGKLTAVKAYLAYEAGAFPGSPVASGLRCMVSGYRVPNAYMEGYDVVVNKPQTAAYRAPGSPQAAYAGECVIDELCEKLGMDPIGFRLKNVAHEGDQQVDGVPLRKIGAQETLEAIRDSEHYKSPLYRLHSPLAEEKRGHNPPPQSSPSRGEEAGVSAPSPLEGEGGDGGYSGKPLRGRGVAFGYWFNAGGHASCYLTVREDGTVALVEGSVDIGGTRATIAMQAAEVLGIPMEDIRPTVVDTDAIGYTAVTGGSSVTFKTGWAAYEAAQDVKRKLIARAAQIWETKPEDVTYEDGVFRTKSDSKRAMTFKQLAGQLERTGGVISGSASVNPRGPGAAYGAHLVDLEVDPETGKVTILRYTAAQDVGKAIHPSYVEGQIQGGVAQGIGWALNEEYFYNDQGVQMNPGFLDYRMPTSLDLPMIETILVEVPNPGHPYGVRGVGEVPIVPPMAAIASAISQATGVRLYGLPMRPQDVVKAMEGKGKPMSS